MKTLRRKFLVYILLPVLGIMTLTGVVSFVVSRTLLLSQLQWISILAIQQAADTMELGAKTGIKILYTLATEERARRLTDAQRREVFRGIKEASHMGSLFMGFPDGRFVHTFDPGKVPKQYDPRTKAWYTLALPSDTPVLVPPHITPFFQEKTASVSLSVIGNNGELIGVIGYHIPLSLIRERVPHVIGLRLLKGAEFSMFDREGRYLVHSDSAMIGRRLYDWGDELHTKMWSAVQAKKTRWASFGVSRDQDWYGVFQELEMGSAYVALTIPKLTAVEPLVNLLGAYLIIGALTLIGLSLILIRHARLIAGPLNKLAQAAVRLSKGDYDQKLEVTTQDELGKVTEAFNTMIDGLRQRDFIRNTFGRYVSEDVAEKLLGSEDALKMGGETREISIMISDIRGFTARTAQLSPQQVLTVLNGYLGKMVDTLLDHQAVVDEIVGDGILAFFGAPNPMDDHPARAVSCALKMQEAMAEVNAANERLGLPILEMGVAISTGNAVVGNIGSEQRAKYGIVGPQVNFTGRIESYTVGGQVLIGPNTYQRVKEIVTVREVKQVEMKGFRGPVNLYDVRGIKGSHAIRLEDETERPPEALARHIPVKLHHLREKVVISTVETAWITHLSERAAIVSSTEPLHEMEEVRMDLPDDSVNKNYVEAFAKVVTTEKAPDVYQSLLRFTYVPDEIHDLLRKGVSEN